MNESRAFGCGFFVFYRFLKNIGKTSDFCMFFIVYIDEHGFLDIPENLC